MCDFCKNIITKEDYKSLSLYDRVFNLPGSFIMKEEDKNNLWYECEDDFYSGMYLEDIKYCPKCGRPLV
jgi:hypothetical protein